MRRQRSFGSGVLALALLLGGGWAAQAQTAERTAAQRGVVAEVASGWASESQRGPAACRLAERPDPTRTGVRGAGPVRVVPPQPATAGQPAAVPSRWCARSTA